MVMVKSLRTLAFYFNELAPTTVAIINLDQQMAFLVVIIHDWLIRHTLSIFSKEIQNQNYIM
jgi:hypothetical protein